MWLKDIYDEWKQKQRRNNEKGRRWWEPMGKDIGDKNAEDAEDYYNSHRGTCPYCNKDFDMPGNLRRHILNEHPGKIEEEEQEAENKEAQKKEIED